MPALGLYYYKARIYSPKLGRFLQTDPIAYGDQVNLYAYVGNDPTNGRDPTGLQGPCGSQHCPTAKELKAARARAVRQAWAQERELVRQGGGTRDWTPAQKEELLKTGRVEGMRGHHMNTVNGNSLESAANPDNIEFLTIAEHTDLHINEGGFRVSIRGREPLARMTKAVGIFGWLSTITGELSGRIRNDSWDNFFSDMTGTPSREDQLRDIAQRCGRSVAVVGSDCV